MFFSKTHEWIKVDGNIGTCGISKLAHKELGEIVFIEFPKIFQKIKKDEKVALIESTKSATEIYSPVSGEIVEVNQALENDLDKINGSPENDGWIFKIKLSNPEELKNLQKL